MANHKSAKKRIRQNENRREINRRNRSRLRTSVKKLRTVLIDPAAASENLETLLPATISIIDKAVQKGSLHRNAAARYKSKLTLRANKLAALLPPGASPAS
ncbi:MAG: 30S ribosomal protein S20 [Pyrinomonadaceae bacterium]